MSEEIKLTEQQTVEQQPVEQPAPAVEAAATESLDQEVEKEEPVKADAASLVGKTIAELSVIFKDLMDSEDRMTRSKEAENIKSAFYRTLGEVRSKTGSVVDDTLDAVEENFKALYADYKRQRAEYNRVQDAQKGENLEKKKAIVEELKALVDSQEDVSALFPAFRALQDRWRSVGPVPASDFRDLNNNYQFNVERFYDKVKISHELRDLDFQKNLEAKVKFCEAAEKLSENENVVAAFNDLQKLHEQWKEFGPVAKEFRESIWERFQAATAVINKKYQAHFEELKGQQKENLEAKTRLCEQIEEIVAREFKSGAEWSAASKEILDLQAQWRKIGFATRKDNQKIYERFRAGCDAFFAKKREFYSAFKGEMDENLNKKEELIQHRWP